MLVFIAQHFIAMLKSNYYFYILFIFILPSCQSSDANQALDEKNSFSEAGLVTDGFYQEFFDLESDSLKQVGEVDFNVIAPEEEKQYWENGTIPWIRIDSPEIGSLIDSEVVIVGESEAVIVIDYPFSRPIYYTVQSDNGFTRRELISLISIKYHELYEEEEESAKTKTIPIEDREKIINRNRTDGKYGICCHDIADLDLSSIVILKSNTGKTYIYLYVESWVNFVLPNMNFSLCKSCQ